MSSNVWHQCLKEGRRGWSEILEDLVLQHAPAQSGIGNHAPGAQVDRLPVQCPFAAWSYPGRVAGSIATTAPGQFPFRFRLLGSRPAEVDGAHTIWIAMTRWSQLQMQYASAIDPRGCDHHWRRQTRLDAPSLPPPTYSPLAIESCAPEPVFRDQAKTRQPASISSARKDVSSSLATGDKPSGTSSSARASKRRKASLSSSAMCSPRRPARCLHVAT